jgi:hypothetical protein
MSISTTIRIPTSTTTLIVKNTSSKLRGKVRPARGNGSMTQATGAESPTKIRELPRSTTREQAAKLRSPVKPIEERPVKVQDQHRPVPAPDPERRIEADRQGLLEPQTVVAGQAPLRWIVVGSRMPSPAWTKRVMPRWRATVVRQAAKACPHNPRREAVAEVPVVAVVPVVVAEAVAVVPVVAAEEDKEERI